MWCRANEQAWPETSEKAQRAGGEKGNRDGDPVVSGPALSFTEWLPLKWLVAEGVVYLGAVQRERGLSMAAAAVEGSNCSPSNNPMCKPHRGSGLELVIWSELLGSLSPASPLVQ